MKRPSPHRATLALPSHSLGRRAFTLVEVVIAVGLFSFAIIGVVFLLGSALQSSSETQRDSAMSSALTTTAALIRKYDTAVPVPAVLYFDQSGSMVATPTPPAATSAYYTFTITAVGSAGGASSLEFWTVKATAPYPSTVTVGNFMVSRLKPIP